MKNENQQIVNILLILAIVLAVGGTWFNLSKLNEVKDVTLTAYAVAGTPPTVGTDVTLGRVYESKVPDFSETSATVIGEDCYLSTDGSQPGSDPVNCTRSAQQNITAINWSVGSNSQYNLTAYFTKNITTEFSASTANNNFVGKVSNLTADLGQGEVIATSYVDANYNRSTNPVLLVKNVTNVPSNINYSVNWAKEFDVLTATGSYTNTLNLVIEV